MKFYRLATEEDFKQSYENYFYPYVIQIPDSVVEELKKGEIRRAAGILKEATKLRLQECIPFCEEYGAFLRAKEDFENGKPVYTDY
ncbi:hypothetical protein [Bacillus sp. Brlt_9]|uniref:hypothetical protein n=1 Tax=Bacillus sp. Brlt_9 TaxID=3110916 RepID=UPI003F7BC848